MDTLEFIAHRMQVLDLRDVGDCPKSDCACKNYTLPPSIGIRAPQAKAACCEAMNVAIEAISSGLPKRRIE